MPFRFYTPGGKPVTYVIDGVAYESVETLTDAIAAKNAGLIAANPNTGEVQESDGSTWAPMAGRSATLVHRAGGGEILPSGTIQTWEIADVTNTRQKLDILGAVMLRVRYVQVGATATGAEFLRFAFNQPNDTAANTALTTIGQRFVAKLEDDWRAWYFDPAEPLTRLDVIGSAAVGGAGRSNLLLEWVLPA